MKKILIMLTALLPHILAAEKATPADPFNVSAVLLLKERGYDKLSLER